MNPPCLGTSALAYTPAQADKRQAENDTSAEADILSKADKSKANERAAFILMKHLNY